MRFIVPVPWLLGLLVVGGLCGAAADSLPNPGFETGSGDRPDGWHPLGTVATGWSDAERHGGTRSVSVADASAGDVAGWATEVPVRPDRAYAFLGWVKAGDDLASDGPIPGAVLAMQFLDAQGQPVGDRIVSPAVEGKTDWKLVRTPRMRPPAGAAQLRLTVGLTQCRGTAWFDDVALASESVPQEEVPKIRRDAVQEKGVPYAQNLLLNGDIEEGSGALPAHWTYVGKDARDWTPEELQRFDDSGRPDYSLGRGRGEWSHDMAYAGRGALLNVSIDPPLGHTPRWHGMNPVGGYWMSDPMPCEAGKAYLAAGWVRPGMMLWAPWYGPLQIQFYDKAGRPLKEANGVRSPYAGVPPGRWMYWATMPWVAPAGAVQMRLLFIHELKADEGGWGRTCADDMAVWALPPGVPVPTTQEVALNDEAYAQWWRKATATVRPPYVPAPAEAIAYDSCRGELLNASPGNVFSDAGVPVPLKAILTNLLGEERTVSLRITRYDWLGNAEAPIEVLSLHLDGYGSASAEFSLPGAGKYGTYYLDMEILEAGVPVGRFSGRYAVLPPAERKRSVAHGWSVTPMPEPQGDGSAKDQEEAFLMRRAGFEQVWVRISPQRMDDLAAAIAVTQKKIDLYASIGLKPIVQVCPPWPAQLPFDSAPYVEMGRKIGAAFATRAIAFGDWGIEQANLRPKDRPIYRPTIQGVYFSDEYYDQLYLALRQGLKEAAPDVPVLVGNIASDPAAGALHRMYGPPVNGQFDGAIVNAYDQQLHIIQAHLAEEDRHGDTGKTVWWEESAVQRSPFEGTARLYGEIEGAYNMIRSFVSIGVEAGARCRALTMWGLATSGSGAGKSDIMILTPLFQPRPQYAALSVLTDALADARDATVRKAPSATIYEWQRADGPLWIAWGADQGIPLRIDVPSGHLTEMDVMGNRRDVPVAGGTASLILGPAPVYLFGGGALAVDQRMEVTLRQATVLRSAPKLALEIQNNGAREAHGTVQLDGVPLAGAAPGFTVKPHDRVVLEIALKGNLPDRSRVRIEARCRLDTGETYAAVLTPDFAYAARAGTPPDLTGTWKGWENAPGITFGDADRGEVSPTRVPGQVYKGKDDIYGRLRVLWDDQNLYLGIEAGDDVSVRTRGKGGDGYNGDSVEFGIQPDGLLQQGAPYLEGEIYLPQGATVRYVDLRHRVVPDVQADSWKASAAPAGHRADMNYQVAIPWRDLGVAAPRPGKVVSLAVTVNDADSPDALAAGGNRQRIRWFSGIDSGRDVTRYGDVILVE